MKAITTSLYVCGGLMVAAAVMGAVDYSSASRKGTLNKLYKEEKAPSVPLIDKAIDAGDYSRGAIDYPVEKAEVKMPEKKSIKTQVTKASKKSAKNKRKVSLKEFSRAPIVDEIVMVDSVVTKK